MSDVKWIKITTAMFDDEKIRIIESMPDADAILVIWIKLLTLAGKNNSNGFIFLAENIPYTDEMLSTLLNRPLSTVRLALEIFKQFGMVEYNDDDFLHITNWDKHQNIDGLELIREQNKLRKRRQREKLKQLPMGLDEVSRDSHGTVTQSHATDIDQDIDQDIIMSPDEAEFISILEGIENYPVDRKVDSKYFHTLQSRYPQLDVLASTRDWAILKQDKPLKKNSNPRSQLNTSCGKHIEWGRNLKQEKRLPTERQAHKETEPWFDITKLYQRPEN